MIVDGFKKISARTCKLSTKLYTSLPFKDRPKPVYTFSAENETENEVIIFVDYSVILHQHQQWFFL